MDNLQYLKSLDKIVLPMEFTYFNHCTFYLPDEIKQKMVNQKFIKGWTSIPIDGFTIGKEMSFQERTLRVRHCLDYGKPLSQTSIFYAKIDYTIPFMIRVIMPKKSIITHENFEQPYMKELYKIYSGLGDGRHEKLPSKTKLLTFASSQVDEISGKKVDIIYCVREIDLDWYASLVRETITHRAPEELVVPDQLDRRMGLDFLDRDLLLERDPDFNRYVRTNASISELEQEYYDIFAPFINKNFDGNLISSMTYEDSCSIHDMFENRYVKGKSK